MFLTVDPGITGTGLVLWRDDDIQPVSSFLIRIPSKFGEWHERAHYTSENFDTILDGLVIEYPELSSISGSRPVAAPHNKVYVEYPRLFGTASGVASAERGDVFKLVFLVGIIAGKVWKLGFEFVPLPVNDWKGNLSKEIIANRCSRALGRPTSDFPNHVTDAVGMGLYIKGVLNATGTTRPKPQG